MYQKKQTNKKKTKSTNKACYRQNQVKINVCLNTSIDLNKISQIIQGCPEKKYIKQSFIG